MTKSGTYAWIDSMINTLGQNLLRYSETEDRAHRDTIEKEIWAQFGTERAVLVWDMSGFSLLTRRHGIIHYLSMVRRMQEATRPVVQAHDGTVVKFEADNGFAVFPDPQRAIIAAIDMNAVFRLENAEHADEFDIRISCGVDHGKILLVEERDFYGDAVNIACKLGEDLARPGEILVGQSADEQIPEDAPFTRTPVSFTISGLELNALRIEQGGETID